MTKTNHGTSSCRGAAAPPWSWWHHRRREESSPCSGPRTAGLPQPPNRLRLRRRRPLDPPRRRLPYPNPQAHQPRASAKGTRDTNRNVSDSAPAGTRDTGAGRRRGRRICRRLLLHPRRRQYRPVNPGPLASRATTARACRWLVSRCTAISGGGGGWVRRGPRRPPPPVAVRPAPLSAPNLFRGGGGGGGRWRPLFSAAGRPAVLRWSRMDIFPRFFRFPQ